MVEGVEVRIVLFSFKLKVKMASQMICVRCYFFSLALSVQTVLEQYPEVQFRETSTLFRRLDLLPHI